MNSITLGWAKHTRKFSLSQNQDYHSQQRQHYDHFLNWLCSGMQWTSLWMYLVYHHNNTQVTCENFWRNPDINVCTECRQFVNNKSSIVSYFLLFYSYYEKNCSLYLRLLFIIMLEKWKFKIYLEITPY